MTVDKSLKLQSRLARPRSVLSRTERLVALREAGKWKDGDSVLGLPKVLVHHAKRRHKAAAKPEAAAAAAPGAPVAEGAKPEAGAPRAGALKGAAPKAGAAKPEAAKAKPAAAKGGEKKK